MSVDPVRSPALAARFRVTVGRGAQAFSLDADLALDRGVLVLFGPSGVGKSLTLQVLAGLLDPSWGTVEVGGEALVDVDRRVLVPAHRRRIGYVPQHHALFPFLDVAGNVAFGLPRAERRRGSEKLTALLDELGLARLGSARPASLSGGERQRVALARALAVEPRLLLLDEPFASIDHEGRNALRALLREVIDRRGVPAVFVTHDAEEARVLGDRVTRFESGKTVASGPPAELLGGGRRVTITGESVGSIEPLGDGRACVTLRSARVEGPAGLLAGSSDGALRLTLREEPARDQR